MKNILVAGGAGFIGAYLCRYLLDRNNFVFCADNFSTGSKASISDLIKNSNFELIEHDIIFPFDCDKKISQIYNLACPASPIHYQTDPVGTIKTNTLGVINLLDLADKYKARILQASTSEIYGDPLEHPQTENYKGNVNPIGPRACYDEGKRVAETLFFEYCRQNNADIKVARIFNTYGPGMAKNDGRVVSNFIIQALNGADITVYGTGEQTRSFCYVSDTVEGLYSLMNMENFTGPVNIGNPEELKILEIARKIIVYLNSKSKIIFKPLPKDDPRQRRPDITLAGTKLNWRPQIGLDEGLVKTIEYFKSL